MAAVTPVTYTSGMTAAAKKLLDEALSLPEEARQELMLALGASLRPVELSDAWREEIATRLERIKSGNAVLRDPMEHLEELRAKFG